MWDLVLRLYIGNATLLITHEIDSAYRKEWERFRLPGGIGFFLFLHFPLVLIILWGVVQVTRQTTMGRVLSLVLSAGGLIASILHGYFLKKGRPEFRNPVSLLILIATLAVSSIQAVIVLALLTA
jgi:hypothetical protein